LSHAESGTGGAIHPTPQSQPVEFNHAINYVNKIKVGCRLYLRMLTDSSGACSWLLSHS
jgi:hypothetical protein